MKQENETSLILVKAADKAHEENVAVIGKETSAIKTNYNNLHWDHWKSARSYSLNAQACDSSKTIEKLTFAQKCIDI